MIKLKIGPHIRLAYMQGSDKYFNEKVYLNLTFFTNSEIEIRLE